MNIRGGRHERERKSDLYLRSDVNKILYKASLVLHLVGVICVRCNGLHDSPPSSLSLYSPVFPLPVQISLAAENE